MNTLAETENAVIHLSKSDFSKFRDWFDALKNKKWDQEFEEDAANGLLDSLADEEKRKLPKITMIGIC